MSSLLAIIDKANKVDVLMKLICKEMDLVPHMTTHTAFIAAFSDIQKSSLEAKKKVQELYVSSGEMPKLRKTRQKRIN